MELLCNVNCIIVSSFIKDCQFFSKNRKKDISSIVCQPYCRQFVFLKYTTVPASINQTDQFQRFSLET